MGKLILVAVLLGACVTLAIAQTRIEVATGQEFTVTLKSNPSTGYGWQLATPVDETKVKFLRSVFNAPKTDRVGAPGVELWIFEAVGKGETTISLKYVRPWEKDTAPAETATCNVVIK
jgi:inhibitor of cysteine peptidase